MGYPNCLMISQMKELDLFDNILYKYIKDIINHDDDDIEVEIEDVDCDRPAYCRTRFKFEIDLGRGNGILKVLSPGLNPGKGVFRHILTLFLLTTVMKSLDNYV